MIRAPIPRLAPGERRLQGAVARYLGRVLRLRPGDGFVAFDPATGREADGTALEMADDALVVRFGALRPGRELGRPAVTWIQGLAKGDKCDAVVRDATELGATCVVVATTRRSVVRLERERARERQARWARVALEAARQCGRNEPPTIGAACPWAEALASGPATAARFCLWERAEEPLGPHLFEALARGAELTFACGPEGGLEAEEVDQAVGLGFVVVSLGPLALRTETVAAAVLGAVRVWGGLPAG